MPPAGNTTTRRDDDTTRPRNNGPYGPTRRTRSSRRGTKATGHGRPLGQVRPAFQHAASNYHLRNINGSPRWRRAGRQAGVAGVSIERIANGLSDERAVCDPLDTHSCHRAKRGAASGQEPVEETPEGFLRGSSCASCFFVRRRVVLSSCRGSVSSNSQRSDRDNRLPCEVTRPGGWNADCVSSVRHGDAVPTQYAA